MPSWLENILPILVLLSVCGFVIARLPKVEGVSHSGAYRRRRVLNWLPLGLTYAFLYMGRYNLTVSKGAFEEMQDAAGGALMGNEDFAVIFLVGTWVYGLSFLINGPLADRFGGKKAILLGALGAAVANLLMGAATWQVVAQGAVAPFVQEHFVLVFSVLYGLNMYFQSFGAVAIVKVNAPWFHLRERGVFGAIFGVLISLGIYFAYDGGKAILANFGLVEVFVIPAILLMGFWVLDLLLVQNTPGEAGQVDFDVADASSGDDGPQLGAVEVFRRMVTNPVIMTIAAIEFCSGFLRQAIMQWYRTFAKQTNGTLGFASGFVYDNWGLMLCCAGILGGVLAGVISDPSRPPPIHFAPPVPGAPGTRGLHLVRLDVGRLRPAVVPLRHAAGGGARGVAVDLRDRRAWHALRHGQHGLRRQEERRCGGRPHRRLRLPGDGLHGPDLWPPATQGAIRRGRQSHRAGDGPEDVGGLARGDDPARVDRHRTGAASVECAPRGEERGRALTAGGGRQGTAPGARLPGDGAGGRRRARGCRWC